MTETLLPPPLVGSYPQPDWLIDHARLAGIAPPRVRFSEFWRVAPEYLEQAQDDATLLAVYDQERAGVDILTDGEMRRESYSNRFATALEGIDLDPPCQAPTRTPGKTQPAPLEGIGRDDPGQAPTRPPGKPQPVPRVVGPIRRKHAVEARDVKFLRANTDHRIKITVPGPFTMSQQTQDDFYKDPAALAMDYAAALNGEIKDLFAAGADIVQIDEPYMQAQPQRARAFGVEALN